MRVTDPPHALRRWPLWAAVGVVLAQTAALAVLTGVLAYLDLTRGGTTTRIAASVTGYAAVMTVLFAAVGAGLARGRRWARGPAVVLEMLQMPIGYSMMTDGGFALGLAVLVAGLAGTVLLLAPATRAALGLR